MNAKSQKKTICRDLCQCVITDHWLFAFFFEEHQLLSCSPLHFLVQAFEKKE